MKNTTATKVKKFRSRKAVEAAVKECQQNGWQSFYFGFGPFYIQAYGYANGFRITYDLHTDGSFQEYSRKELAA